jgi:hypothetical protein
MAAPVEALKRKPDEEPDYEMLDAVAEDILHAVETKDARLLKEALSSLIDHIQDLDEVADKQLLEGSEG